MNSGRSCDIFFMSQKVETLKIYHLVFREILGRKMNFFLSLAAVIVAAAFFVSFFTIGHASKQETTRLMRDMGFNLRIIHKDTDMEKFWRQGYSEITMPESHVFDLASHAGLSYAHMTAILQKIIKWRDREVFLTGIAPEVSPPGKKKSPMAYSIPLGSVFVGFEIARSLGINRGDTIHISDHPFLVERTLSESGNDDDVRIYAHLDDVQTILREKDKINEIKALQCLCVEDRQNINDIQMLRNQLKTALPDTKVFLIQDIASARESQRLMAEKYFSLLVPFVIVVCMAWLGIMSWINARERRQEIGIMRALGYDSAKIASLFLGKAAAIGFIGAGFGFVLGTLLSMRFGPEIFKVTAHLIKPQIVLLYWALIVSSFLCALSAFIPAVWAVTQEPAVTLREE